MDGNFFVGAAMATTLTKLALRYCNIQEDDTKKNRFVAECMLVMASVLHYGRSGMPVKVTKTLWLLILTYCRQLLMTTKIELRCVCAC